MSLVADFSIAKKIFRQAREEHFALPAVNVINSNTINAVLETAREVKSAVIIQLSNGGAHFFAGKSLPNTNQTVAITGAIAAAEYVHSVSDLYQVPVLLNTDHASRKLLPWVDGLIAYGQKFFEVHHKPLFTSHMIDLSEEPLKENIDVCKRYLEKLTKLNMYLEIELGVTGGEEDGVNNTHVENSKLYTQPEQVGYAYEQLSKVSDNFVIAASFGNVHGVYAPGNVKLEPTILKDSQDYICRKFKTSSNPVSFVFHGGSGSEPEKIREAISYGVVKMNIDTDIQWAFWQGVHAYYQQYTPFLQSQIGNAEGSEAPNKKYYDPRAWLRHGETALAQRLKTSFTDLNALNTLHKNISP